MKKLITLISFLILLSLSTTSAMAAEEISQSQSQELETEVVCETGSYGEQSCYAKAKGTQEQSQYVKILGAKTHVMEGTALDTKGKVAAFGIMAAGSVIAINKFKKLI